MRDRGISDRVSPILVKELRQGVKAHLFAGALILLHLFLVLSALVSLAARGTAGSWAATALFWVLVCVPLLVLMPLSGVRSISGEIQAKTLELVLLTRLSAYRIVVGKWVSIVVTTVLLAVTILPYVVLRYFLGGVDLWKELLGMGVALLVSAFLSAVTTTLSAVRISIWLKWGIVAIAIYALLMEVWHLGSMWAFRGSAPALPSASLWPALIAYAALFLLMMLEAAAVAIAPPSENHATRIRLLALVFTGLGGFMFRTHTDPGLKTLVEIVTTGVLVAVCITGLCEPIRRIPALYAPFLGRGARWRLVAPILAPGWPSGAMFAAVSCVLVGAVFEWPMAFPPVPRVVALIGALLLPLALIKALPRVFGRFPRTLVVYLLLAMAMGVPDYLYFAGKIFNAPWVTAIAQSAAALFPLSYFCLGLLELSLQVNWHGWENFLQLAIDLAAVGIVAVHGRRGWQEAVAIARGREPGAAPAPEAPGSSILGLDDRA